MNCPFCGAAPKQIWHGEVISFTCGTQSSDQMPRKAGCWQGLVWKLKERLEVLEGPGNVVVRHDDVVEAVRYTGWACRAGWWQRLRNSIKPKKILDNP